jgi:hypothetical protein
MSRRTVSGLFLITGLAKQFDLLPEVIPTGAGIAHAQPAPAPEISAAQWMSEWMGVGRPISGGLYLMRFKDPTYVLTRPISWSPGLTHTELPQVTVPKGFVTDLASIPRVFWSLLRPDGEYAYAAIIHDYLYWVQDTSRERADLIFRLAMKDFRIDATTAFTIYTAVRVGGPSGWDNNTLLKSSGEKRFLKRFPEDPTVTWEQWRKEQDVFAD